MHVLEKRINSNEIYYIYVIITFVSVSECKNLSMIQPLFVKEKSTVRTSKGESVCKRENICVCGKYETRSKEYFPYLICHVQAWLHTSYDFTLVTLYGT